MATYRQIQDRVRMLDGFVPKTCWIADIKNVHGLTQWSAPNRKFTDKRLHPCPPQKRMSIELALRHFGMIP